MAAAAVADSDGPWLAGLAGGPRRSCGIAESPSAPAGAGSARALLSMSALQAPRGFAAPGRSFGTAPPIRVLLAAKRPGEASEPSVQALGAAEAAPLSAPGASDRNDLSRSGRRPARRIMMGMH